MSTKSTKPGTAGPTLVFTARPKTGTTGARADRGAGHVPGVLYGHGSAPMPVSVEARALDALLHGGHSRQLIEAMLDGRSDTVLVRELQRDPISRRVIHADFQRVSRSEEDLHDLARRHRRRRAWASRTPAASSTSSPTSSRSSARPIKFPSSSKSTSPSSVSTITSRPPR